MFIHDKIYYQDVFFRLVPTILQLDAHTSIVSFLHAFITQWYSNEVQECVMFLQPFFLAASFHSLAVFGHDCTILAVAFDSLHLLSASAFTNICNWTLPSHYFMKTCIQYHEHHYRMSICLIMHLKTLMIRLDTLFTNCFIIKKWRRKA